MISGEHRRCTTEGWRRAWLDRSTMRRNSFAGLLPCRYSSPRLDATSRAGRSVLARPMAGPSVSDPHRTTVFRPSLPGNRVTRSRHYPQNERAFSIYQCDAFERTGEWTAHGWNSGVRELGWVTAGLGGSVKEATRVGVIRARNISICCTAITGSQSMLNQLDGGIPYRDAAR